MTKTNNPWKTLSSKKIYENPWIRVQEDKVINPGGGEGIYGTVQFKNTAIGIIPHDEDDFTWLVGQYRYPLNAYSWEIPEGGGAADEDPEQAARRELLEETGITAFSWQCIQTIHTSNSVTNEIGYIYLATNLAFGEASPEESESDLVVKKVHLRDALEMVLNNGITDSLSIAGILRAARIKGY